MFTVFNSFILPIALVAIMVIGLAVGIYNGAQDLGNSVSSDFSVMLSAAADPRK